MTLQINLKKKLINLLIMLLFVNVIPIIFTVTSICNKFFYNNKIISDFPTRVWHISRLI